MVGPFLIINMRAKTNPNRNITRIDTKTDSGLGETHGFEVRIMRRGKSVSKFFSDAVHGGKKAALNQAKGYRDKMEKSMKGYTRAELMKQPTKRNKSGYPGVRIKESKHVVGEWEYTYYAWEASWTPKAGGKRVKKSFSVDKYGDDEAFKMAVAARKKAVSQISKEDK